MAVGEINESLAHICMVGKSIFFRLANRYRKLGDISNRPPFRIGAYPFLP